MAIVITKEGNLAKVDNGSGEPKYFNINAMANSFSLNTAETANIKVSARAIDMWEDDTPLSQFTIAGHSGMTTVSDFDSAIIDLTTIINA